MKSKGGRGRPKLTVLNALDMLNLREEGTQYNKSIKIRESTYNILVDIRDHDKDIKTIDEVIMKVIIASVVGK